MDSYLPFADSGGLDAYVKRRDDLALLASNRNRKRTKTNLKLLIDESETIFGHAGNHLIQLTNRDHRVLSVALTLHLS